MRAESWSSLLLITLMSTGCGADDTQGAGQKDPAIILSSGHEVTALAIDSTSVYWGDADYKRDADSLPAEYALMKTALDGSATETLATLSLPALTIKIVDGTIYWNDNDCLYTLVGGGSSPSQLLCDASWSFALDGNAIYWPAWTVTEGSIKKMPLAGGNRSEIIPLNATATDIAVDATSIYWVSGNTVNKASLDGEAPVDLARSPTYSRAITLDATHVYWTSGDVQTNQGAMMRVLLGGGEPELLASGAVARFSAVNDTHVYFTAGRQLLRVGIAGGPVTVVADGCDAMWGRVGLDNDAVYWGCRGQLKKRFLSELRD